MTPGILLATDFASNASTAFGDLVQWADLIASLYILGHHVTVMKDFFEVGRRYLRVLKVAKNILTAAKMLS